MVEAVCPPGLGHHRPLGPPKDPRDVGEWWSQPRASARHIPAPQGRGNHKENGIFPRSGVVTAPPGCPCPLRAGMGDTLPAPAVFP